MSRKLNQIDSSSSYDLMLDVLSNVFGGVILISCLLAILPRHVAPPPLLSKDLAKREMVERRIALKKSELDQLLQQIERLSGLASEDLEVALNERAQLKKMWNALDKELTDLRDLESKISLVGSMKNAKKRLSEIKAKLNAADQLNKALQRKLETLTKQLKKNNDNNADGNYYYVQLPQEKGKMLKPMPVIIRYGRIYPLSVGSNLTQNGALLWTEVDDDATKVTPIHGTGLLLPKDVKLLSETLRAVSSKGYSMPIYLYPDSYNVFQSFKKEIFKNKIRYGLEFVKADRTLTFSSKGSSPPEL